MGDAVESVFITDVHGHVALGVDLVAGIFGGIHLLFYIGLDCEFTLLSDTNWLIL